MTHFSEVVFPLPDIATIRLSDEANKVVLAITSAIAKRREDIMRHVRERDVGSFALPVGIQADEDFPSEEHRDEAAAYLTKVNGWMGFRFSRGSTPYAQAYTITISWSA